MSKKIVLSIISFVALIMLSATCFAAPPSDDYQLVLSDEFDGTELNRNIWDYRTGNPYGGKNLKENVRVKDGMLYLDYKKVTDAYTGGGILTKFTLPYGYYEVKAKVFSGVKGLHTSFWTSGADAFEVAPENAPFNNWFLEIDAFEINSREDDEIPNVDHGINIWCAEHTVPFSANYYETNTTDNWFVMGMEWLPNGVNYYINGELINSFDGLNIFGPSYLWLTAVATPEKYSNGDGTYNIADNKMDENGYFGSSLFDYFRYYQKSLKGINLMGNPNFEYNRATDSSYPSAFVLKGDKSASYIQKTPLAYDGLYYHTHQSTTPYSLSTGQEFAVLAPGKYTFKGKFKATNGLKNARIVVYDKEGNVLAEKPIPKSAHWTEVALTDIQIDSYAYAAVESASDGETMLSIDALEFYIQDGETYSSLNTPYYEYIADKEPLANFTYGFDDAKSATGTWNESGTYKGTYWLSGDLRDVEVAWHIPVTNSDTYHLEVKNIISENNTKFRDYYITTPDGTEEKITIDTKNGVTRWDALGKYDLNAGDTLKISMKSNSNNGNVRITKLRLASENDIVSYKTAAMRLFSPVFSYLNTPYAFDKTNPTITPYEESGIYYIPYKPLKEATGFSANIDESSLYVTTTQLEEAGIGVTLYENYIFLHDKELSHTPSSIIKTIKTLQTFCEPYFPKSAVFIANEDTQCQIVSNVDSAFLTGSNWEESTYISDHKYSGQPGASATWEFDAPNDGIYAVDIYSPSHTNCTANAEITVFSYGKNNTITLNQTGKVGWYRLSTVDVKAGEKIKVYMEQKANGLMRVAKVRLVPLSITPKVTTLGANLLINLGNNYSIAESVILAEYIVGVPTYTIKTPDSSSMRFTLIDKTNPYKLFFWKSLESAIPLCEPIQK